MLGEADETHTMLVVERKGWVSYLTPTRVGGFINTPSENTYHKESWMYSDDYGNTKQSCYVMDRGFSFGTEMIYQFEQAHSDSYIMRKYLFLIMVVLMGCSSIPKRDLIARISPEPEEYAWFLRTEFIPGSTEIRGIPIAEIDPSWRYAAELRKDVIPLSLLFENDHDSMKENNLDFTRSGDFNYDDIIDLALVGVFEKTSGERGSFLLILTKDNHGKWIKSFLDEYVGENPFQVLSQNSSDIEVWYCMNCDYGSAVAWDEAKKTYVWKPFKFEDDE